MIPWSKFFGFAALLFVLTVTLHLFQTTMLASDITTPLKISTSFSTVENLGFVVSALVIIVFVFKYRPETLRKLFFVGLMGLFVVMGLLLLIGSLSPRDTSYLPYFAMYICEDIFRMVFYSLLFWVFANQSFSLQEAKLSYPLLLGLGGTSSFVLFWTREYPFSFIQVLITSVVLVWSLYWVYKKKAIGEIQSQPKVKGEVSIYPYLGVIGIIVLLFMVSRQILSEIFKLHSMNLHHGNHEMYNELWATYLSSASYIGIPVFVGTFWMVWKLGWYKSALVTPFFIGLAALCLLFCHLGLADLLAPLLGVTPETITVFTIIGIQGVLGGLIPTVFLTTKEMSFIALPLDPRAKGRAIVHLITNSYRILIGGSLISFYSSLFTDQVASRPLDAELTTTALSSNHLSWLLVVLSIFWILSVNRLSTMYTKLTGES